MLQKLESIQRIAEKVRIPLLNKEDKKALLGLRYDNEEYHFSPAMDASLLPTGLSERDMKSFEMALYGIKSLNGKSHIVLCNFQVQLEICTKDIQIIHCQQACADKIYGIRFSFLSLRK